MLIEVEQSHWHEFVADAPELAGMSDGEFAELVRRRRALQFADGRRALRIDHDTPAVTSIHLPDSDVERMLKDSEAAGLERTREWLIADHLENAVLPFHAPGAAWSAVRVPGDVKLEAYLAARLIGAAPTRNVLEVEADD